MKDIMGSRAAVFENEPWDNAISSHDIPESHPSLWESNQRPGFAPWRLNVFVGTACIRAGKEERVYGLDKRPDPGTKEACTTRYMDCSPGTEYCTTQNDSEFLISILQTKAAHADGL